MDSDDDAILDDFSPPAADVNPQQQRPTAAADHTSEDEQTLRRKKIQEIMSDGSLSQHEKSKAVQALMDGRRRSMSSQVSSQNSSFHSFCSDESASNYASLMARAAAQAHDYFSSDEEGDAVMNDALPTDDVMMYGYNHPHHASGMDERSVASSVTHTSFQSTHSTSAANTNSTSNNSDFPRGLTYRQVHGRSYSLQDWTDYDRAAAAANTTIFGNAPHPAQINRMMELSRPQCQHYERNCTIVSPCCGLAFGCRICHDECPVLPMPLSMRPKHQGETAAAVTTTLELGSKKSKMDRRRSMPLDLEEEEENHHAIDRFLIREVICRSCHVRQSSKA